MAPARLREAEQEADAALHRGHPQSGDKLSRRSRRHGDSVTDERHGDGR